MDRLPRAHAFDVAQFLSPEGTESDSHGLQPVENVYSKPQSPERATAIVVVDFAVAPPGLETNCAIFPGVETPGYLPTSLRD